MGFEGLEVYTVFEVFGSEFQRVGVAMEKALSPQVRGLAWGGGVLVEQVCEVAERLLRIYV